MVVGVAKRGLLRTRRGAGKREPRMWRGRGGLRPILKMTMVWIITPLMMDMVIVEMMERQKLCFRQC